MNHFHAVCRSNDGRRCTVHEVGQDTVTDKQVDTVNMNKLSFRSIYPVIIAKQKIS